MKKPEAADGCGSSHGTAVAPDRHRKEVPMKHLSSAITALLVAASVAVAGHAQPVGSDASSDAKLQSDRRGEAADRDREKKGELELCKEKALGLDGPERARFMTECLRGAGRS
jgi:hypothetical protein